MSTSSIVVIAFLATLIPVMAYFVFRILRNTNDLHELADASPADRESLVSYYRPLRLLLDPDELAHAKSLAGDDHAAWRRFRRQRIRAFRCYLRDLEVDFRRLEFKLRYLLLAASASDAQWVHQLNRLRAQFALRLFVLEFRLLLFSLGLGTINASALLEAMERMEQALSPSAA